MVVAPAPDLVTSTSTHPLEKFNLKLLAGLTAPPEEEVRVAYMEAELDEEPSGE